MKALLSGIVIFAFAVAVLGATRWSTDSSAAEYPYKVRGPMLARDEGMAPTATPTRPVPTANATFPATPTPTLAPSATPTSPPPPQGSGLVVSGSTFYKDSIDYWHVVGLVTNYFPYPVEFVEVTANFYGSGGVLLATDSTYTLLRAVPSGGTAPFEALEADVPGIVAVEVQITDYDTDIYFAIPNGLQAAISSTSVDIIDFGHVLGTVKNTSSTTWTYVQPIVAVMKGGQVVDVDFTFTKPNNLAPGQTRTFEVLVGPHPGFDPVNFSGATLLLWVDADE